MSTYIHLHCRECDVTAEYDRDLDAKEHDIRMELES